MSCQAAMRKKRTIAAPTAAKTISAVTLDLPRYTEAADDLLQSPKHLEDWANGDGILAGVNGAPWDFDDTGGGEGSPELDGTREDELAAGGNGEVWRWRWGG